MDERSLCLEGVRCTATRKGDALLPIEDEGVVGDGDDAQVAAWVLGQEVVILCLVLDGARDAVQVEYLQGVVVEVHDVPLSLISVDKMDEWGLPLV